MPAASKRKTPASLEAVDINKFNQLFWIRAKKTKIFANFYWHVRYSIININLGIEISGDFKMLPQKKSTPSPPDSYLMLGTKPRTTSHPPLRFIILNIAKNRNFYRELRIVNWKPISVRLIRSLRFCNCTFYFPNENSSVLMTRNNCVPIGG